MAAAVRDPGEYNSFSTTEETETASSFYADQEENGPEESNTEEGDIVEGDIKEGFPEKGDTEEGVPEEGGMESGTPEKGGTENSIPEEGDTENEILEEGNPGENVPEDHGTGENSLDESGRTGIWPEGGLAALLPMPEGDLDCLMICCDDPSQFEASLPTDKSSYESYIVTCMSRGFEQEAVSQTFSGENGLSATFQAFNTDGYKLELRFYPWFDNCFLDISVKLPMPLGALKWWDYALGLLLPRPETTVGVVRGSPEAFLDSYLGEMPLGSYHEYIEACKAAGFNQNAVETEREYFATDEDGIEFSASYYGNNIMWLRLFDPEQKWRAKGLGEAAAGGGEGGMDTIGGGEDGADSTGGAENGGDSIGDGDNGADSVGSRKNDSDSIDDGENGVFIGDGKNGAASTGGAENGGDSTGDRENSGDPLGDWEDNTDLFEDGEDDVSRPDVIPVSSPDDIPVSSDDPNKEDLMPPIAEPTDSGTSVATTEESSTMAHPAKDTPAAADRSPFIGDTLAEGFPEADTRTTDSLTKKLLKDNSHTADSSTNNASKEFVQNRLREYKNSEKAEEDATKVLATKNSEPTSSTNTSTEVSNPDQGNLIMQITTDLPTMKKGSPITAASSMHIRNLPGQKTRMASAVAGLLAVCAILSGALIKRRAFFRSL